MRRQTVYVGQVPLETDILNTNKNILIAIGHVLQDMIGTSTLYSGLGCVPTSPAGMTVNVNPGRAYSLQAVDAGAYSSLPADAHQIVKQGIILDATNFSCPAPTTAGFSINYLVQGAFQEIDGGSTVLPFYNASNPAQAYSGPNGSGASSTTYRDNTVQLSLKAGVAATTGTQVTPTPDAGFNGLWVITVPYGATTITSSNISQYAGAPFLSSSLLSQIQQAPNGVAGQARNVTMSVASATSTASLLADEILVETALGGQVFKLSGFNKSVNLSTTGAGGMDAGSAPASGYVALYAIYNPTTQVAALLAVNAVSAIAPNIYGGANMPSGYTASGLVGIVPTNASSQFAPFQLIDRNVALVDVQLYVASAAVSSITPVTSTSIPKNAVLIGGNFSIQAGSSQSLLIFSLYASNASGTSTIGTKKNNGVLGATNGQNLPYEKLSVNKTQTFNLQSSSSAGTPTFSVTMCNYDF